MKWIDSYLNKIYYQNSEDIFKQLSDQHVFVITDKNLEMLYPEYLNLVDYYSVIPGENSKTLVQVQAIMEKMLDLNYTRQCLIIGFGGGLVTDLAGFVASIYKRGCNLALIPTSLIAMVDASIGGKNGVNSSSYKNQFGCFKQADWINIDLSLLNTLPDYEFFNGIPEMIKHGLLYSETYYEKVLSYAQAKLLDQEFFSLIKESINIKLSFVNGDINDKGNRMFLNFGHTLGHVVEKNNNLSHGKSVLWGMKQAIKISANLGLINKKLSNKILTDLTRINRDIVTIGNDKLLKGLQQDKKREKDLYKLVLISDFGKPVFKEVSFELIKESLNG